MFFYIHRHHANQVGTSFSYGGECSKHCSHHFLTAAKVKMASNGTASVSVASFALVALSVNVHELQAQRTTLSSL